MRPFSVCAVLFVAFAAVAPPGAALHCNGVIIEVEVGAETLYIDDRSSRTGEIDHWVYMEANTIEGLQSGDEVYIIDQDVLIYDPCTHRSPDQLII